MTIVVPRLFPPFSYPLTDKLSTPIDIHHDAPVRDTGQRGRPPLTCIFRCDRASLSLIARDIQTLPA